MSDGALMLPITAPCPTPPGPDAMRWPAQRACNSFRSAGEGLPDRSSDEQADVGLAGKLQERRRAAVLDTVDELAPFELEQVHRHLAGDELHVGLEAQR